MVPFWSILTINELFSDGRHSVFIQWLKNKFQRDKVEIGDLRIGFIVWKSANIIPTSSLFYCLLDGVGKCLPTFIDSVRTCRSKNTWFNRRLRFTTHVWFQLLCLFSCENCSKNVAVKENHAPVKVLYGTQLKIKYAVVIFNIQNSDIHVHGVIMMIK